jgi:soluble lytic murein transglycosylase-like protein
MLAASPTRAADAGTSLLERRAVSERVALPGQRTFIVRADPRTGRLVRSVLQPKPTPKDISDIVEQAAKAHAVDPLLVHSMIRQESNYDTSAISPKGAEGLMQLIPSTAKMMGATDSFDAKQNIEAGVKYLKYLQGIYKDDRLALAAYNAGPGAVQKYGEVPPYKETQDYVNQVGKRYSDARQALDKKTAAGKQAAAEQVVSPDVLEEKHPTLEQFFDENGRLHLRTTTP